MNAAQVRESAHTAVSELVCDLGEYAMRDTKRQRQESAAARMVRSVARKAAQLWDACPGPWPVKVALVALALIEPGPFGEMALVAVCGANAVRKARKAGGRNG